MSLLSYAEAQVLLDDSIACFQALTITKHICLLPKYIHKLRTGIREHLNNELRTFSDELDGVIIAYDYDSLKRLGSGEARIFEELPFLHLDIRIDAILFKPSVGCTLNGVVNKLSDNHVGCLVHNCFNASISKPYILQQEEWEGSRLTLGEEFFFTVTQIVAQSHVLFMRGAIPEGTLSMPEPLSSASKKKKKHKKRKRASDSEAEQDDSTLEPPPKKKHNRKSLMSPGFSSPAHTMEYAPEASSSRLTLSQDDIDHEAADLIALVQKTPQRIAGYSKAEDPDPWPSPPEVGSDSGVSSLLFGVDKDQTSSSKSKTKKHKWDRAEEDTVTENIEDLSFTLVTHKKKKKKKHKKFEEDCR